MRRYTLVCALAVGAACAGTTSPLSDGERLAIARDVRAAVDAFADAERRMDAEALVSFLSPDFYMYGDGVRSDYDTVVEQIRSTMPTLQKFETTWSDIEVTVLARDHALVSMLFEDAITDAAGETTSKRGPNTFVWRLQDDGWKLIYVDADHYPVGPDPEEAAVLAVVETFFDTLATGDRAAAEAILLPEGLFHAVRQSADGWALGQRTHRAHLNALGTSPDAWVERMWDPTVFVHERIAVVWTPYDFHINGEFSHCGVDAFSLVKIDDAWRIAGVTYTTEPADCEASPLGPLPGAGG